MIIPKSSSNGRLRCDGAGGRFGYAGKHMSMEFIINTDPSYFENWLNDFHDHNSPGLIELESDKKWYGVFGGPVYRNVSHLNKITLEMRAHIQTRKNAKSVQATHMFPFIRFELLQISPSRTKINAKCLDAKMEGYFERILEEIAKLWPESRKCIFNEKNSNMPSTKLPQGVMDTVQDIAYHTTGVTRSPMAIGILDDEEKTAETVERFVRMIQGKDPYKTELNDDHEIVESDSNLRARKRGMSEKRKARAHIFKKIKDEHPHLSYPQVAARANLDYEDQLDKVIEAHDVRNDYRDMGWRWQRADRTR